MAFEGALSIGVDQVSNSLIISAEEEVYKKVLPIVTLLDEEAKPDTVVQVHEMKGSISATDLQKALATAMGTPWPGGKPETAVNQNGRQGDNNNNGDNSRGDRGRRRRDRGRGND